VLGGAAYLFTGLSRFSELHGLRRTAGTGLSLEWRLLALGIGNGRQAGGHELCPQALADDGLLDISILPAPQELVGTLKTLLSDGFGIDNMFVRARLPWVEIKVAEGLSINLDGEPLEGDSLRFEARPAALRVHLPEHSPLLGGAGSISRQD
jgi:diacylglycerol kinase family enzyme